MQRQECKTINHQVNCTSKCHKKDETNFNIQKPRSLQVVIKTSNKAEKKEGPKPSECLESRVLHAENKTTPVKEEVTVIKKNMNTTNDQMKGFMDELTKTKAIIFYPNSHKAQCPVASAPSDQDLAPYVALPAPASTSEKS